MIDDINKPTILKLECLNNQLIADLSDGRKISIPFDWFDKWGHKNVKAKELCEYEIFEEGRGIYFPKIEEFVHINAFTDGINASCS